MEGLAFVPRIVVFVVVSQEEGEIPLEEAEQKSFRPIASEEAAVVVARFGIVVAVVVVVVAAEMLFSYCDLHYIQIFPPAAKTVCFWNGNASHHRQSQAI